jgi:hypothetical protein
MLRLYRYYGAIAFKRARCVRSLRSLSGLADNCQASLDYLLVGAGLDNLSMGVKYLGESAPTQPITIDPA